MIYLGLLGLPILAHCHFDLMGYFYIRAEELNFHE